MLAMGCMPQGLKEYLSPSMDLKSFTMAMPSPAVEYSIVSTMTSSVKFPNSACSHHSPSAMLVPEQCCREMRNCVLCVAEGREVDRY